MPVYDYQCQQCEMIFEVRATFKEKEAGLKPECPQCHSKKTRQRLTSGLFLRVVMARPWNCQCADPTPVQGVAAVSLIASFTIMAEIYACSASQHLILFSI